MDGSPLYDVAAEHLGGAIALLTVPIALVLLRGRTRGLAPIDRLLVALLLGSAAIHLGLLVGNDHGPLIAVLFAADAGVLLMIARRVLQGRRAGRLGVAVLTGSIVAYWLSLATGEAPDQVGMATKLAEILALAIVIRPSAASRRRKLGALARNLAICSLVVATAASAWIGAFRASAAAPGAVAGHHVHAGGVPPPGTIFPAVTTGDPTPAERAAAASIVAATRIALARYADPAVAAADGYNVAGLAGIDFHASNPAYEHDGRILDPAHPESLVYAVAPDGRPVLLGALFVMPDIGESGPIVGGPLMVWHAHEDVCISLTPPGLTGLLSPFGTCPFGSVVLPRTAQMIHVWIVPGAPEVFGDLDDTWKRAYLAAVAASGR